MPNGRSLLSFCLPALLLTSIRFGCFQALCSRCEQGKQESKNMNIRYLDPCLENTYVFSSGLRTRHSLAWSNRQVGRLGLLMK